MNRNRSLKPSTIVILLECVFVVVVFVGYLVLSSKDREQPLASPPEIASKPTPSRQTPAVASEAVAEPANSSDIIDSPPMDLVFPATEVPTSEIEIFEAPTPETALPLPARPEQPPALADQTPSPKFSIPDSSIVIGSAIKLQLNDETRSRFYPDLRMLASNTPNAYKWWWPTNSDKIYGLKARGNPRAIYSVSRDAERCTMLASLPHLRYIDAYGNDSEIYLLRTDTSDKRFRLISDHFALQTLRITASRTLLDLPSLSSNIDRVVWDPHLSSLALTLRQSGKNDEPILHTSVLNLKTGQERVLGDAEHSTDNAFPLGYRDDGQRLILASPSSSETVKTGGNGFSLIEMDFSQNRIQAFGSPTLPNRIPYQISGNTHWAVYAVADQFEVWNTVTGRKHASISNDATSAVLRPGQHPRVTFPRHLIFARDDSWFAFDNGDALKIYSTDTGKILGAFPENGTHRESQLETDLNLFSFATDSGLLVCGIDALPPFPTSLRGTSEDDVPSPWLRQISLALTDAKLASARDAKRVQSVDSKGDAAIKLRIDSEPKFTNWMSPDDYDAEFPRLVSGQRYPVTVEGRFHLGQRQYRACFVDCPEKFGFYSHHDQREHQINTLANLHRQNGFREVWRQSFVDDQGTTWWSGIWTRNVESKD